MNPPKQKKDEEISSLRKGEGKKRKAPMEYLDAQALKSHDTACKYHKIHLAAKKHGFIEGIDNEHD